jgi:hypothetical protein
MPKYLRNDNCFSEDKEFFPISNEFTTAFGSIFQRLKPTLVLAQGKLTTRNS